MKCNGMLITFNIYYIICIRISILTFTFNCNPALHICLQNTIQKLLYFLLGKGFQQISGCLYLIALNSKIRRCCQKYNRYIAGKRTKFSGCFHTIQLVHIDIQKKQFSLQVSLLSVSYKYLTGRIFLNANLLMDFFKIFM